MSFRTSSMVTSIHFSKVSVDLCGTSYVGVDIVDARTDSTLSLKKAANSSAVCASVSSPVICRVLHGMSATVYVRCRCSQRSSSARMSRASLHTAPSPCLAPQPCSVVDVREGALEPSLSCSCTATSCTTVGVEPRGRLLVGSASHCHCGTMLVEQSSHRLRVQLNELVDGSVFQGSQVAAEF